MSSPLSGRLALLVVKRVYLCSHSCLQTFSPLYFSLNPFVCKIWHFHIFIAEQIPDFGSIVQKIRCSYWHDRKTLVELTLPILYNIHTFVFRLVFPSGQIRLEAQIFSHTHSRHMVELWFCRMHAFVVVMISKLWRHFFLHSLE